MHHRFPRISRGACEVRAMQFRWEEWESDPRDILITRVRRGEITPEEAEQEAQRLGLGPFATKPDPGEFDPDKMYWWSLPMAVAWIAWRNSASVRERCAENRRDWIRGSWNVPTNNGTEYDHIDGYELKTLRQPTVYHLLVVEADLTSVKKLPPTTIMTVAEAEKQLFAELAAGRIKAIAKDAAGNAVDIPQRQWPYLQLFEDGQADVLKYADLDRAEFSEIKLPRETLKQLWPELSEANARETARDEVLAPGKSTSPALQQQIREAAKKLWPNGDMPARVKDRDAAIAAWFSNNNQTVPSERTIRRAFN
jgi:hypothetical protein